MKRRSVLLLLILSVFACKNSDKEKQDFKPEPFDRARWRTIEEGKYPFRNKMLADFMANYKMNGVKKDSILYLLGTPDRTDNGHLFYNISKDNFSNTAFILHTKTLVVKLTKDSTVEWRKIHE
jgi:hypothetical protein